MSSLYTGEKVRALSVALMLGGWFATSFSIASPGSPPAPGSVEEAVNGLVADALAANLELDEAGAGVAQRLAALDQARALYLPALDFSARYTRANGGRTIEFPVGDL